MWLLLNSAGRCSATCDQTGSRRRPKRGAAQLLVGVLELLDLLGVPPDHHVGVGTQAAQVVDAADDDVVGLELGDQLLDLACLLVAEGVLTEDVAQPEHRPHRVADRVVELACLPGAGPRSFLGHGSIVARSATTFAAASSAEAMQAGIPTPSYAEPQTASPGSASSSRRTAATRSR